MPDFVALVTPPILAGPDMKPANGDIYIRSTNTVAKSGLVVVPFQAHGKVVDGTFKSLDGGPLLLVVTPEGVALEIHAELVQDGPNGRRDKYRISRTVSTPNATTVTWDALIDVIPVDAGPDVVVPSWVAETKLARDEAVTSATTATNAKNAAEAALVTVDQKVAAVPTPAELDALIVNTVAEPAIMHVSRIGSDTADGTTWGSAKATVAGAIAALPPNGGKVLIGGGIINETGTLEVDKAVRVEGLGCYIGGGSVTTLQFPPGVSGIRVNAGGQTSKLSGFRVVSLSSAAGTDDGILVRGHGTILDELHVENFGRDGLAFDTTGGGNANACTIGRVRSLNNRRHGLYMDGVDANLLTALNLEVVLNGGWGVFINQAPVYGGVFLSPNIDRNTLGGVSDAGTGTRWISPDVEPGPPGYNVTLTGPGIVWESDGRTRPVITYGPGQRVLIGGVPLGRLNLSDATGTKTMAWTMGVYEASSLGLVDVTNSVNILNYRPLTQRFEHLTPVLTKALYQTSAAVPFSSAVAFTCSQGNVFTVSLTGNVTSSTIGTANVAGSPIITIVWVQDSVGGRTYAWPANCRFAGGSAPTDSAANTSTSVTFRYDLGAAKWYEIGRATAVPA